MYWGNTIGFSLLALSLAGCTKTDKPDNPPLLGQWQIEAQLVSSTVDNVALEDEEIKLLGLDGINKPKESLGCTEPNLGKAENVVRTLPGKFKKMCTVRNFDGDQKQFIASVSCTPSPPIKDMTVSMSGQSTADNVTLRNAISIGIMETEHSTSRAEIVQRITWTRLGDCT